MLPRGIPTCMLRHGKTSSVKVVWGLADSATPSHGVAAAAFLMSSANVGAPPRPMYLALRIVGPSYVHEHSGRSLRVFVKKLSPRQWASWGSELPHIARMDYLTTAGACYGGRSWRRLRAPPGSCRHRRRRVARSRGRGGRPGGVGDHLKFLRAPDQRRLADHGQLVSIVLGPLPVSSKRGNSRARPAAGRRPAQRPGVGIVCEGTRGGPQPTIQSRRFGSSARIAHQRWVSRPCAWQNASRLDPHRGRTPPRATTK
jgi:hypothetical protein